MRVTLKCGYKAEISRDGRVLILYGPDDSEIGAIEPPEHGDFYHFAYHAVEGECPIVSFAPEHKINGWPDWYYKIDVHQKTIERLNPWR